ncbi:esterase [candidate division KSB1 bacterium]|nr:MAG: esterase [candidate division KSB1 bacterium]
MAIWTNAPTIEDLNRISKHTMVAYLGIEYTELGDDYLKARMPADERTKQPAGLLHGGANAVLAETLGSMAGTMVVDQEKYDIVGVELNVSHLRPVFKGYVEGVAHPVKLGQTIQVWEIKIFDEHQRLTAIGRLTLMVVRKRKR